MTTPSDAEPGLRPFIIYSNLSFILPLIYLLWSPVYTSRRAVHLLLTALVLVASTLYHECDSDNDPHYCLESFTSLYMLDFTMSIAVIVNLMSYNLIAQLQWLQDCALVILFVGMHLLYYINDTYNTIWFYLFGALLFSGMVGIRGYYRYQRVDSVGNPFHMAKTQICWWLPLESNLPIGGVCVVGWVTAIVIFSTDYTEAYNTLHSVWHLLGGIMMTFTFYWLDSMPTFQRLTIPDTLAARIALVVNKEAQSRSPSKKSTSITSAEEEVFLNHVA